MHSFLKRYRAAVHPRLISDKDYFKIQHDVIAKIVQRPECRVYVACDPEDPAHIYAYLMCEELAPNWLILHWIYTKGAFRKWGLAKSLIAHAVKPEHTIIQYSHKTALTKHLDKAQVAVFNPYYVWALL